MAAFTLFECLVEDIAEKVHDLGSDQLVVALTNTAPDETSDTILTDITEIAYTYCSSRNITTTSSAQTSGVYTLALTDLTLTASGGAVGPFRYAVIYNDTSASDSLIGYSDFGAATTLADTETFDLDFDDINGVLTLTIS